MLRAMAEMSNPISYLSIPSFHVTSYIPPRTNGVCLTSHHTGGGLLAG